MALLLLLAEAELGLAMVLLHADHLELPEALAVLLWEYHIH